MLITESSFEDWADSQGYDTTLSVSQDAIVRYGNGQTQAVFEAWTAGLTVAIKVIADSIFQHAPLIERVSQLAERCEEAGGPFEGRISGPSDWN